MSELVNGQHVTYAELMEESENLGGLCNATYEDGRLTMPENHRLPLDGKLKNTKMLVRSSYIKLYELMKDETFIYLTGTPGTGEVTLIGYIVYMSYHLGLWLHPHSRLLQHHAFLIILISNSGMQASPGSCGTL